MKSAVHMMQSDIQMRQRVQQSRQQRDTVRILHIDAHTSGRLEFRPLFKSYHPVAIPGAVLRTKKNDFALKTVGLLLADVNDIVAESIQFYRNSFRFQDK